MSADLVAFVDRALADPAVRALVPPANLPALRSALLVAAGGPASPEPADMDDETLPAPPDGVWNVYVDGSCSGNPGPGGWAAVFVHGPELSGGTDWTTNGEMEVVAALRALERTPVGSTVNLVSDSQYVVNTIDSYLANWKAKGWRKADGKAPSHLEHWKRIDALVAQRRVRTVWTKGHSTDALNNRADELAQSWTCHFAGER